jgi:hypothetical protein
MQHAQQELQVPSGALLLPSPPGASIAVAAQATVLEAPLISKGAVAAQASRDLLAYGISIDVNLSKVASYVPSPSAPYFERFESEAFLTRKRTRVLFLRIDSYSAIVSTPNAAF